MPRRPRHLRLRIRIVLAVAGCLLLAFGTYQLAQRYRTTHSDTPPANATAVQPATDQPDETPVDGPAYKTAPDQPRRIGLAAAGIDGYIQAVGTDPHGKVLAPGNVHMAGWYTGSVKPGEPGLSIIDGHVQGRYEAGVFKRLAEAKTGQRIVVEYGDGTTRNFTVERVATVDSSQATDRMYDRLPNVERQLTLITCAGQFDRKSGSYSQRSLVYASYVPQT